MPYIRGKQLVEERWKRVEELYKQGLTQKQISLRLGLATSTISLYLSRKRKEDNRCQ